MIELSDVIRGFAFGSLIALVIVIAALIRSQRR